MDTETGAKYTRFCEGMTLSSALNTVRSAKDFFFPQTENLVEFKMEGKSIEVIDPRTESEDFVVFGVRSCDARSFSILDKVFLADPVDTYYKNRREHGTIVSMACTRPQETCFCGTFDIDATDPEGDVASWKTEDAIYFDAKTEKGGALLAALSDLLSDADSDAVNAQKEETKKILAKLPLKDLTTDGFGGDVMMEKFNAPEWKSLSEACLGCGTCTFVCPTCQCYDIKDFNTGHGIKRFRCWDSCMYSDFTKMAHGNPRTSQLERFRQRFMHKLVYFPANNNGEFGCVGCGRCLQKCPISSEIKETLIPQVVTVTDIRVETPDIKTFRVATPDGKKPFAHLPGQCAMLSVPGISEAMISITSSPTKEYMEFSIKECGCLTTWLHSMEVGQQITVRGPYGNSFPVDTAFKGKDLLFIAGGVGLAPLHSVINYVRDKRENYGHIDIVYGSRSMDDLMDYNEIVNEWCKDEDVNVYLTIDREQEGWDGHVGFVPNYVKELGFDVNKTAIICGPPIMIKFTLAGLQELGFDKTQVFTTMELRMKCGIGKCGRCNIGSKYVCKDGPVFRCDELDELPNEY